MAAPDPNQARLLQHVTPELIKRAGQGNHPTDALLLWQLLAAGRGDESPELRAWLAATAQRIVEASLKTSGEQKYQAIAKATGVAGVMRNSRRLEDFVRIWDAIEGIAVKKGAARSAMRATVEAARDAGVIEETCTNDEARKRIERARKAVKDAGS